MGVPTAIAFLSLRSSSVFSIPRSRLTEDIAADLASAGTPIAAIRIGNRVALAQAMALGLGVIENARMTPAAAEISALAEEIRGARFWGLSRGWSAKKAQRIQWDTDFFPRLR